MKLNIIKHICKVIICLKKIKINANNFQNEIIFLILIKYESKNYGREHLIKITDLKTSFLFYLFPKSVFINSFKYSFLK